MKYEKIVKANFISRPNRFVARVLINEIEELAHVKNTGRCKELLVPDATVYLEDFSGKMGTRKMRYSIIAVEKGKRLINMDSQAPNKVVEEALNSGELVLPKMKELTIIKPETTFGNSRFDFYLKDKHDKEGFLEVKGVTLESNGIVKFPDAPTSRGIKHVMELCKAKKEGYNAYILFLIQMADIKSFEPNIDTQPDFGMALIKAKKEGVEILAYDTKVKMDALTLNNEVEVVLL